MSFILIETNTKNNKERPYVRLFTKARLKYYLENSPNDPPLLPENELNQATKPIIHDVFSVFIKKLQNMLNKYFPLVRQSRKQFRDKEWITEKLKADIKKKNELYRKYIEKNTETSMQRWKDAKYKVTEDIRKAQTQYYRSLLLDHSNSSQKLWNTFGKILKNSKSKVKINKIKVNNKIITDPLQITSEFNNFFINIGSNLANKFDNQERDTFREYLNPPILESFCLLETSKQEVKII